MEAPPGGVDDMTKLSYLHEPGVLQNLSTRYELNEIYVSYFVFPFYFIYFRLSKNVCCVEPSVDFNSSNITIPKFFDRLIRETFLLL